MEGYDEIVALEAKALDDAGRGNYDESLANHAQALEISRSLKKPRLIAVILERIGETLEAMGDVQRAVVAFEAGFKALAEDETLNLREILSRIGAISKGFDFRRTPIPDLYSGKVDSDLKSAMEDPALPAVLLINAGNMYLRQFQEGPALNDYNLALKLPHTSTTPSLKAHILANIGEIMRRRGEIDAAKGRLQEAVSTFDSQGLLLEKRLALALLAGIARDEKQAGVSESLYHQALTLYSQANDPLGEGRAYAGLGLLYLEQKRFGEAESAYGRALEIAKKVNDADTLWHAHWGLGRCQWVSGQLNQAASSFRESLNLVADRQRSLTTDEGKVTFIESVGDIFDDLVAVHLDRAKIDADAYKDALEVAEEAKGRALIDLMAGRQRRYSVNADGDARPRQVRLQSSGYSRHGLMGGSVSPVAQMAPGVWSGSSADFELTQENNAPEAGLEIAAANAPSVLSEYSAMAEGTSEKRSSDASIRAAPMARLVFYALGDRTASLAVTPDGKVFGHISELGVSALAGKINSLRAALGIEGRVRGMVVRRDLFVDESLQPMEDPEVLLKELYSELVAPLAGSLPEDGSPVIIEPHGVLWLLPFSALIAQDGTFMADRWPMLFSPSFKVIDEIRKELDYGSPKDLKILVIGNPKMPIIPKQGGLDITLDPLPGAEKEAREIASLFPADRRQLLTGDEADKATVENLARESGVVHLATHGIAYSDKPLASFIALAEKADGNGILTAREVMDLSLPADLVSLSACQTGLGKISGDGILGLSRAFLVAGARSVLVSLWSVDDEATEMLMAEFYKNYLNLDDKAVALQRAMQKLRAVPGYSSPVYWAPFTMIGAEA